MSENKEQICPSCNNIIEQNEDISNCPNCNSTYHQKCWDGNNGCRCEHYNDETKQDEEQKEESTLHVCTKCNTELTNDQSFCPMCGTKKQLSAITICPKCGEPLPDNADFCAKCGHKIHETSTTLSSISNQLNKFELTKDKKKLQILIGCVVVVIIIVFVLSLMGPNFNSMFSKYSSESWCTMDTDGNYMIIDTNPYDIDGHFDSDANKAIKEINEKLEFSSSVYKKMGQTRSLDGRQTESNGKYQVSWIYHPDNGLEVMYEVNK